MPGLILPFMVLLVVAVCGSIALRLCALGLRSQSANHAKYLAVSTIVLPPNFFKDA